MMPVIRSKSIVEASSFRRSCFPVCLLYLRFSPSWSLLIKTTRGRREAVVKCQLARNANGQLVPSFVAYTHSTCDRMKIRCDKNIPCGSCVKRGCAVICPSGMSSANAFLVCSRYSHLQRVLLLAKDLGLCYIT